MNLEILTPDKKVFDGEIVSVTVPGTQGAFEVLNNHAPVISTLEKGQVIVRTGNSDKEQKFLISGGAIEVINNKIIVLAETAKMK